MAVQPGDCASDTDSGYYVDGTVTSVILYANGDLGFGFVNNDEGTGGGGVISDFTSGDVAFTTDPFAYSLGLQQQNYSNYMQKTFGAPTDQQKLFTLQVAGMEASHDLGCAARAELGMIPFVGHFLDGPKTPFSSADAAVGGVTEANIAVSLRYLNGGATQFADRLERLDRDLGPFGAAVGGLNAGLGAVACMNSGGGGF